MTSESSGHTTLNAFAKKSILFLKGITLEKHRLQKK